MADSLVRFAGDDGARLGERAAMQALLEAIVAAFFAAFRPRASLVAESLALRQQLAALRRG